ncbi:hypothetical protein [Kitasatospora cheerisanensis]|uniref:hypothetical protein n=1 Tax=Kitasatospora cheerisanensis TaxID=81942 RepID=UPI000B31061A|nr:hypothetical protein [Kitasatospora cheerisanensis]
MPEPLRQNIQSNLAEHERALPSTTLPGQDSPAQEQPRDQQPCQAETRDLAAAISRLLAGEPIRSDGKLTVSVLAAEAAIARQRLYEHHREALTDFKTRAGGGPLVPNQQALQQRLDDVTTKIKKLEAEKQLMKDQIASLTVVVVELTHEAQAKNIIKLPPRRRRAK